ncbi:response regulator [uncultured Roseobacter sp.]|uniref:response regulator n=1 Tax=uncultured Roseobacter sp. TaxID=114847 RepID=UPI002625D5DD|nr:response regulator [uncultured Roseobacter sp.]
MTRQKKILIVEDDNFNRYMIKAIIETLDIGLHVDLAEDGKAGCETIERAPDDYALVLMDIHMPRLSGLEATDRIRANAGDPPRHVPIVAVTADADYHHPMAVEAKGMNGFLAKPIAPGELLALIDRYCSAA